MPTQLGRRHLVAAALLTTCAMAYAATLPTAVPSVLAKSTVSAKTAPSVPASVFMSSATFAVSPELASTKIVPLAAVVTTSRPLAGVNISGGEFGTGTPRLGYTYAYPTKAEIDYFAAVGMEIVRIPFRWERMQPVVYGPLSVADRAGLKSAVDYAVLKGLTVVLDMHDYGARNVPQGKALVGSALLAEPALADAWLKIAGDYRDQPKVWLGLMNEPFKQTAADWWRTVQQLTVDLRNQDISNKLLIPGSKWTGAHSWVKSGNAAEAEKFVDPDNNFAFEVHQYLDSDSSGTSAVCKAGSASRVDAVLNWAATRKVSLFFGEIGGSADAQCAIEYPAMLAKLDAHARVVGWTAWGGGRWWNAAYMFRLAPIVGQTTPHLQMVKAAVAARKLSYSVMKAR